jgi:hypothetical protein
MNETTYGKSPAAMYLARVLNEINDPYLNRAIGKRISGTSSMVKMLVESYQADTMSSSAVSGFLSLMYEDMKAKNAIKSGPNGKPKFEFAFHLCYNVRIGMIRSAKRMCQRAKKSEKCVQRAILRDKEDSANSVTSNLIAYRDKETGSVVYAGKREAEIDYVLFKESPDDIADLLHQRSNARNKRLGKPYTKV